MKKSEKLKGLTKYAIQQLEKIKAGSTNEQELRDRNNVQNPF